MEETTNPQQAPGAFVDTRPSWDEYFMKLAEEVATRTTCLRRAVGAVVVKDRRILATGYNGVPTGLRHCAETGCLAPTARCAFGAAPTRFAVDSTPNKMRSCRLRAMVSTSKVLRST